MSLKAGSPGYGFEILSPHIGAVSKCRMVHRKAKSCYHRHTLRTQNYLDNIIMASNHYDGPILHSSQSPTDQAAKANDFDHRAKEDTKVLHSSKSSNESSGRNATDAANEEG